MRGGYKYALLSSINSLQTNLRHIMVGGHASHLLGDGMLRSTTSTSSTTVKWVSLVFYYTVVDGKFLSTVTYQVLAGLHRPGDDDLTAS